LTGGGSLTNKITAYSIQILAMGRKFYNSAVFLTSLVLCFVFSGCDVLYRLLDKEGAQEKALVGEIVPHERNSVVEEVQALLYLYGYNTGNNDGILGLRTRNAIEQFQKDNGLKSTRSIDQATWQKLNIFKENKLVVNGQLNVRFIQAILKEVGFNPGTIDGKMGEKTKVAIEKFQEAHGLKVDGKIGYQTLSKLATFITAELQLQQ
jgi:peptidoglycan hydrolase-like protein with peptidoglycan-binding domain